MKKLLIRIVFLFFLSSAYAQTVPTTEPVEAPKETYYTFIYTIEPEDSFASILRLFVKDDAVISRKTPLVGKIMRNNTNVKNWAKLPVGQMITLYIPGNFLDGSKFSKFFVAKSTKLAEAKKVMEAKTAVPSGVKGSVFYMASLGDFSQSSTDGTNVSYNQNSYGTFGFQGNFYPKESLYSLAASFYVSAFTPADTVIPPNSVTLPPEIGMNIYGEYLWKKNLITFHAGLDYEKFSSFNLIGIEEQQRIFLDRLSVFYLTAGLSHVFTVYKQPLFTRFSISQSFLSDTTSEYKSSIVAEPESLTGMKVLFYLNYKFTDKFFFHSMLKYHKMSGPSDLTSTRLGLGVGYILF